MLREAVQVLLKRETYAYTALWESLTLSQRRLLMGLASEEEGPRRYSRPPSSSVMDSPQPQALNGPRSP